MWQLSVRVRIGPCLNGAYLVTGRRRCSARKSRGVLKKPILWKSCQVTWGLHFRTKKSIAGILSSSRIKRGEQCPAKQKRLIAPTIQSMARLSNDGCEVNTSKLAAAEPVCPLPIFLRSIAKRAANMNTARVARASWIRVRSRCENCGEVQAEQSPSLLPQDNRLFCR